MSLTHFEAELLTILELSEFVAVFAEPKDLRTVKAAARCLKASVSGPPPATSKSCLSNSIEVYVFPEPLVPVEENSVNLYLFIHFLNKNRTCIKGLVLPERIIACGYPVSDCCLTASWTTLFSWGASGTDLVLVNVNGFPTSVYGFTQTNIGPTFV